MKKTHVSNYQEKLNNLREFVKNGSSRNCIDVFQSQVEEAKVSLQGIVDTESGEDLEDNLIRTLSKDLSRYHDSFQGFQRALSEMDKGSLPSFRKKIVHHKNFFEEIWGEESDSFFRSRKFFSTHLKDQSLISRLNASLDCIITSLRRYTYKKYGG